MLSNEGLARLDSLRNDLKRAVSTLSIVQTSIAELGYNGGDSEDALYFVFSSLYNISGAISTEIDKEFVLRRASK